MTVEDLEDLEDRDNEAWEEYYEFMQLAPKLLLKLGLFAGLVNIINLFSWEAALGTVALGFAYGIQRIGYFCCTGR